MSYREEILEQALTLPPADRAFVAAALGESLLPDALAVAGPDAVTGGELLAELQAQVSRLPRWGDDGTSRSGSDRRSAPLASRWAIEVNLRILAAAEAEIVQAREYLEGQGAGLGNRFLDDFSQALEAIGKEPQRFRKLETLPESQPYRRALLTVFRYAVVFETLADEILVVAVCHTSREPNYWLARLGPSA